VSALFDRENRPRRHPRDVDEDTAEIPTSATIDPHDPDLTYDPTESGRSRLRPTIRARRIQTVLLLGAYAPACLGSAWLAVLAYLRFNALVMVMMIAAAMWLGRDAVGLVRWLVHLSRPDASLQPPQLSRLQRVVACVLAAMYAYLLLDWLLHQ
jgi:hypothetical protein